MKDKHRVTYFNCFETYILKIHREISKLHVVKVHMHDGYTTTWDFSREIMTSFHHYDISPSCWFSHATAHIMTQQRHGEGVTEW